MTYYEELGVEATASGEEIRHAYKHLARLIHPDHCGDEATRRLAELQMKRLNGMLEVLLDSAGRDDYDRSLTALAFAVAGEAPPVSLRRLDARWAGPLAATVAATLLMLLLLLAPSRPQVAAPVLVSVAGASPANGPRPARFAAARPSHTRVVEPDIEWEPLATYAYSSHVPTPPPPFAEQAVKRLARESAPSPEGPAAARSSATLAGDWLFVPTGSIHTLGYPPEYIELRLRHEGAVLQGRYRASYRVTDRAISPNVAFQFAGTVGPEGGTLPWRGASGAKGAVTMRLLPGGDLEVSWEADELGRELGLISGTATLVRKLE